MVAIYDVLKASKGIHVDDTFAELWGRKLSNAYTVATYTGTLPTTLQTVEGYLENYKIYGNTEQAGAPTPENPIMPSGCGERTENLLPFDDKNFVITAGGSNLIVECKNGDLYMKGAVTEIITTNVYWKNNFTFELEAGEYYCNSPSPPLTGGFGRYIKKYDNDLNLLGANEYTFTLTERTKCYLAFYIYKKTIDSKIELMLNAGSTALPYEPYGYKLPLISAGQDVDMYLGEVQTTRRIKKLALTGEEAWVKSQSGYNGFYFYMDYVHGYPHPKLQSSVIICNIATFTQSPVDYAYYPWFCVSDSSFGISTESAVIGGTEVADWKSYLAAQYAAGTPVTVWYVLAEPETGIVNEPLMKIGDYADTIDSTQATVQIPTAAGETTISWAGDGLAPSQVELTYRKRKGQ